jgi:hypothetical protein
MFNNFFKERSESRQEVQSQKPEQPYGFRGMFREMIFQSDDYEPQPLKVDRPLWSKFSASIYTIEVAHLSVILARYADGTILWLDDHASDSDFETFVRRERLSSWLPDQVEEMLDFLVRTKFNFMGWPRLVRSASDIPVLSDPVKNAVSAYSKEGEGLIIEAERRLADVTNRIGPPMCVGNQDKGFQLKFYIWTKIAGSIIEVNCFFGPDLSFRHEAVRLMNAIGAYVIPS